MHQLWYAYKVSGFTDHIQLNLSKGPQQDQNDVFIEAYGSNGNCWKVYACDCSIYFNVNASNVFSSPNANPFDNQWHHHAIVYCIDGGVNRLKYYMDGKNLRDCSVSACSNPAVK